MSEIEEKVSVGILTISDRCSSGETTDISGQNLNKLIDSGIIPNAKVEASGCVSDDEGSIVEALQHWCDHLHLHLVLTTGGTGFSPRDVTPEAVKKVIDREATGLSILMTTSSIKITVLAALSRPVCGIRSSTIIVTLPGSAKGAEECLRILSPVLPHAIDLLAGRITKVGKTHAKLQATGVHLYDAKDEHRLCSHHHSHHHHHSGGHHSHHQQHNNHSHAARHSECSHSNTSNSDTKVDMSKISERPRSSPYPMISVDEAQQKIFSFASSKSPVQIGLNDSVGFVLAEDIVSNVALPPFPASIKDGYAVISQDGAGLRKVVGGVAAGDESGLTNIDQATPLTAGDCFRINTGAPVPEGADAVVQVEDTELIQATEDGCEELQIKVLKSPSIGLDIRPQGCDIEQGQVVLSQGSYLGPPEIGLAASVGVTRLIVYPKPIVGLLSTGNEVQSVDTGPLKTGRIYDSNLPTLQALLRLHHITSISGGIAQDNPQKLKTAITALFDKGVEVLVTTGSVSMGDRDILRAVLQSDFGATIHFAQVKMKPGKPTTFATLMYEGSTRLVLGLPGNPVSATVTAQLYLLPLCKKIAGRQDYLPTLLKAKLQHSIRLDPRPEYHRASLSFSISNELPLATSTGNQLSSRLLSCAAAAVLLVLPSVQQHGTDTLQHGAVVSAMLLQ